MAGHDGVLAAFAIGPTSEILPAKRPSQGGPTVCFHGADRGAAPARRAKFQPWIFSYGILVGLANFVLSRVLLARCRSIFCSCQNIASSLPRASDAMCDSI